MIGITALMSVATSYLAWYLERHETRMVYPFAATYAAPVDIGEPRLIEPRFRQSDGTSVILWRAEAMDGKPTIVYFPGNSGGLKDRVTRFQQLLDAGYGLVAVAYRGSSGSGGTPSEALLTADARAIVKAETARPLVLYGESLGTSLAVKLAAEGHSNGVVLEAPFTSIVDVVAVQFPLDQLDALMTQRWSSLSHAPTLRQPLLVVHGTEDRIVPITLGEELFAAAGSTSKRFLRIEGRGHTELWTPDMRHALHGFLDGVSD